MAVRGDLQEWVDQRQVALAVRPWRAVFLAVWLRDARLQLRRMCGVLVGGRQLVQACLMDGHQRGVELLRLAVVVVIAGEGTMMVGAQAMVVMGAGPCMAVMMGVGQLMVEMGRGRLTGVV